VFFRHHPQNLYRNYVPRRISGPKKQEVAGRMRKLHTEDLNHLRSSPYIIKDDIFQALITHREGKKFTENLKPESLK
jgi:hypothetical protein